MIWTDYLVMSAWDMGLTGYSCFDDKGSKEAVVVRGLW
jgi:hypothetical protein